MRLRIIIGVCIFVLLGGGMLLNRTLVRDFIFNLEKPSLPPSQPSNAFQNQELNTESEKPSATPLVRTHEEENQEPPLPQQPPAPTPSTKEINLAVPFTSQAPHANWNLPYQETCEEASLLMVARYKKGESIHSPEDADQEILKLVEFQNGFFGDYKDTTAEQTAEIAREYYGFKNTTVKYDFTVDDIKHELAQGNPVIIPAAGRQLPNPYFRSPGPLYHMLVIRGYTATKFITNDPGTRRGEEFVYTYSGLLDAVHDWNGGNIEQGRKVMLVVK